MELLVHEHYIYKDLNNNFKNLKIYTNLKLYAVLPAGVETINPSHINYQFKTKIISLVIM
jgi:hypothetical protein